MKKLFFTAIALVAFSGVSMANSVAVEETVIVENVLLKDNCTTVAQLAYNLAISEGADHPTAVAYSNIAYTNCKKSVSIEP